MERGFLPCSPNAVFVCEDGWRNAGWASHFGPASIVTDGIVCCNTMLSGNEL